MITSVVVCNDGRLVLVVVCRLLLLLCLLQLHVFTCTVIIRVFCSVIVQMHSGQFCSFTWSRMTQQTWCSGVTVWMNCMSEYQLQLRQQAAAAHQWNAAWSRWVLLMKCCCGLRLLLHIRCVHLCQHTVGHQCEHLIQRRQTVWKRSKRSTYVKL